MDLDQNHMTINMTMLAKTTQQSNQFYDYDDHVMIAMPTHNMQRLRRPRKNYIAMTATTTQQFY